MRFHFVAESLDGNPSYFRMPVFGNGYFHNLTMKIWSTIESINMAKIIMGDITHRDDDVPTISTEYYSKGQTATRWDVNFVANEQEGDPGSQKIFFAHRAKPLYTRHGKDIYLIIQEATTVDFISITGEWVPFKNTIGKYRYAYKVTDPGVSSEDYQTALLLPFSCREGSITLQAFAEDSSSGTNEQVGYMGYMIEQPGVQRVDTLLTSGWGVVDTGFDVTGESKPAGGSERKLVVIGNRLSGLSYKTLTEALPKFREGASLKLDFFDVSADVIDEVHIIADFMFRFALTKRMFKGHFFTGDYVTTQNESGVTTL